MKLHYPVLLLLVFTFWCQVSTAQVCSSNAGGDFRICSGDTAFFLFGVPSNEFISPPDPTWRQADNNPQRLVIRNGNTFNAAITPPTGNQFAGGIYLFELCATCKVDNKKACDIVQVTIMQSPKKPDLDYTQKSLCDDAVVFDKNQKVSGITYTYKAFPVRNRSMRISNDTCYAWNEISLYDSCRPYIILEAKDSVCITLDSIKVSLLDDVDEGDFFLNIFPVPSCDSTITIRTNSVYECGSNAIFWIDSVPSGSTKAKITIDTIFVPPIFYDYKGTLHADVSGIYKIGAILITPCKSDTVYGYAQYLDLDILKIPGDTTFIFCDTIFDLDSILLGIDEIQGVSNYKWSLSVSTVGANMVEVIPNKNKVTVKFNNTPWVIGPDFRISIRLQVDIPCGRNTMFYSFQYTKYTIQNPDTINFYCPRNDTVSLRDYVKLIGTQSLKVYPEKPLFPGIERGFNSLIVMDTPGVYNIGMVVKPFGYDYKTRKLIFCTDTSHITFIKNVLIPMSAGSDITTCVDTAYLNGSPPQVSKGLPVNFKGIWRQIDGLPPVRFSDNTDPMAIVTNFQKGKTHILEFRFQLDSTCLLVDTMRIQFINCASDTCAIIIQEECLPNGSVKLIAKDASTGKEIVARERKDELIWSIKDGPNGKEYQVVNMNGLNVSNHTKYCVTREIYSYPNPRLPKLPQFAEICRRTICDTIKTFCPGPCEDFSFILSSFKDDYAIIHNLNFPPKNQLSVCENPCMYFIGIFTLDGKLIDGREYDITWSNGQNGNVSMQNGCYDYTLEVIIKKGDCIWRGRYLESCCDYEESIDNIQCNTSSNKTSINWDSIPGTKYYELEFNYDATNISCAKRNTSDSFPLKHKVYNLPRWTIPTNFPSFFIRVKSICRSGLTTRVSPWIEYCKNNKSCNLRAPAVIGSNTLQVSNAEEETTIQIQNRTHNIKSYQIQYYNQIGQQVNPENLIPGIYVRVILKDGEVVQSERVYIPTKILQQE